ncbi:MFS transporter [Dasania marina]|uniref:MFS transporter n=1 Tax=Dasania marina TaxID=471499 RepID=UPI00036CE718|nr:MFS transporter [Dasania marina]
MNKAPTTTLASGNNLSLCLISFVATISLWPLMVMPIIVGAYIDYLGFDEGSAGWVSSANLAGIAIITLIVSLKTKHWPLEKVARIGLAAMIFLDIASLYFHSLTAFSFIRFLSGLAGAATAAAIAHLEKPEKGYGIYIGFQFLLPAIAIYYLAQHLPSLGFNGMMYIIILLEVVALCASSVFTQYPLNHNIAEIDRLESSIILQPPALLSLLSLCIYGAATAAIWAYADRMGLAAGLSSLDTGNALSYITAISISGALAVIF